MRTLSLVLWSIPLLVIIAYSCMLARHGALDSRQMCETSDRPGKFTLRVLDRAATGNTDSLQKGQDVDASACN